MAQTGADDVVETVQAWLVDHLKSFTDAEGLKEVVVWEDLPDEDAFLNTKLKFPALAVMTDGLSGDATKDGRTGYDAAWRVVLSVWVNDGRSQRKAVRTTRKYAKAVRSCMLSAKRLNWTWVNESYSGIDDERLSGLMGLGTVEFDVWVKGAANTGTLHPGPVDPLPIVTDISVDVKFRELNNGAT